MLVKAIKLMSGEEIIGEVISESVEQIAIKNPVAVMMQRTPEGDIGIGFVRFAPYLGEGKTLTFAIPQLVFLEDVDESMKNKYTSAFGGVVVPDKKLILG